ncbi:MAG: hypothetical protein RIM23_03355 [Coleofasciculus sp. G3-WIS-01]|uniref:hypothetical protein n=1 Tax=Coleofasciculus sp. G3-WIS-01 TaxID=3069528 RepID=UPI0033026808
MMPTFCCYNAQILYREMERDRINLIGIGVLHFLISDCIAIAPGARCSLLDEDSIRFYFLCGCYLGKVKSVQTE